MTYDLELLKEESLSGFPNGKSGALRFGGVSYRDPLLPAWASRIRERELRYYYRHSNNTTFKSVVAGISKRAVSTPYEIIAGRNTKLYCDNLLRYADLGSWERFVTKLITDFSRQDVGAFVEIIAPGNPLEPYDGRPTGIRILDPLRCYLTGDPEYPVIYWNTWPKDRDGQADSYHVIHQSRVKQFPDMPDSDEYGFGTGECALSRCIAPVYQEILMSRYVEQMLDDKPQPGYRIMNNVTDAEHLRAREKAANQEMLDNGGYGAVVDLYSLQPEYPIDVRYVTHSVAPPGFDYEAYTNLNAKKFAAGLNVDIQEFWELSGGGIGTGTQSEILAEKSRGKLFGRILKGIERFINDLLPDEAEFMFKYEDAQEDMQRAEIAEKYANVVSVMGEGLSVNERRRMMANQVEAVRDAIIDEANELARLNDRDPKPDTEQVVITDVTTVTGDETINSPEQSAQIVPPMLTAPQPMTPTGTTMPGNDKTSFVLDMLQRGLITIDRAQKQLGLPIDPAFAGRYMVDGVPVPADVYNALYQSRFGRGVESFATVVETASPDRAPVEEVAAGQTTETTAQAAAQGLTTQKAYNTTRAEFVNEFAELIDAAKEGILPQRSAYVALRSQLKNRGVEIYLDGLRKGGVEASAPDEDGQTALATWLAEQSSYLRSFVDKLFENPDSVDAARKADEWANGSLDTMYFMGLADAAPNKRYKWQIGSTEEHCDSCLKLNGQVHKIKDYRRYGLMPKSKRLVCFGVNCLCSLVETNEPASGNLRAVRYVRREHVH